MRYRIGVNLGDVIEDERRIYGYGVNIAARVEDWQRQEVSAYRALPMNR